MNNKKQKLERRKKRIRAKIIGSGEKPRLSVFRSNKHILAQIIDDLKGVTYVSFSSKNIKEKKGLTKKQISRQVGKEIAKKAVTKKITNIVFDKGGYKYHGRVKELAEGLREGGLKF